MKRPADQAKLLFFALLRSTATALATTGEKGGTRLVLPPSQNILLRLATRHDVPSIQNCNLACLPENYNSQFYCSHLRQWPDLALVAEDVSGQVDEKSKMGICDQDRHLFSFGPSRANTEPNIVAYVLGKIETRPVIDYANPTTGEHGLEALGHVTSLAVRHDYRRLGLARTLMTQLHHHLQDHGIHSCGLHVRTSNRAACRLYQEDGYEIAQIIPSYYQDGEDAYFMRKLLHRVASPPQPHEQSPLFGRKVWKAGTDELRLPRQHKIPYHTDDKQMSSSSPSGSSPELLTGTM